MARALPQRGLRAFLDDLFLLIVEHLDRLRLSRKLAVEAAFASRVSPRLVKACSVRWRPAGVRTERSTAACEGKRAEGARRGSSDGSTCEQQSDARLLSTLGWDMRSLRAQCG
jgi:hypothetical protein